MKALAVLLATSLAFLSGGAAADHKARRPVSRTDVDVVETLRAVMIRDGLITSQEAPLNMYRCGRGKDTALVPGGCSAPVPVSYQISVYLCILEGTYTGGDLRRVADRLNIKVGSFFA